MRRREKGETRTFNLSELLSDAKVGRVSRLKITPEVIRSWKGQRRIGIHTSE